MLVYLFRQRRTDDLALTTDVTGRIFRPSLLPRIGSSWALSTSAEFEPPWDTADFRYAVRQARMTGFHLFEPGRVLPPPMQIY